MQLSNVVRNAIPAMLQSATGDECLPLPAIRCHALPQSAIPVSLQTQTVLPKSPTQMWPTRLSVVTHTTLPPPHHIDVESLRDPQSPTSHIPTAIGLEQFPTWFLSIGVHFFCEPVAYTLLPSLSQVSGRKPNPTTS